MVNSRTTFTSISPFNDGDDSDTPVLQNRGKGTFNVSTNLDTYLIITVTHWQSRLHAKSKPSIKFFDIKNRFFSKSGNADENPDDNEDDSWLDEPDINVFPPEDSLHVSSNINLSSQCLAAALSEEPIGNMTASETSQPNPQEGPGEPSELDDDFSMYL